MKIRDREHNGIVQRTHTPHFHKSMSVERDLWLV